MRNGNFLKICVSEIRVKRIRVNQGLGVIHRKEKGMKDPRKHIEGQDFILHFLGI